MYIMEITCSSNRVLLIYVPSLALLQPTLSFLYNTQIITIKMITLKEYEIYLKVKKFIESKECDENDIIPKLINGIGIIPAYVPLIIESNDMEPTKYYSLSVAARGCGILK